MVEGVYKYSYVVLSFAMMGHNVTGVDISAEAIHAAQDTFSMNNLSYIESDYDTLRASNKGKYDVAIFIDSLQ